MEDLIAKLVGMAILGAGLYVVYLYVFRPEKVVEKEIEGIERQLRMLKKGGRLAKVKSFLMEPWLKGDVARHIEYLKYKKALKKRELIIYGMLKGGAKNG